MERTNKMMEWTLAHHGGIHTVTDEKSDLLWGSVRPESVREGEREREKEDGSVQVLR
jgi:hypothetical protein